MPESIRRAAGVNRHKTVGYSSPVFSQNAGIRGAVVKEQIAKYLLTVPIIAHQAFCSLHVKAGDLVDGCNRAIHTLASDAISDITPRISIEKAHADPPFDPDVTPRFKLGLALVAHLSQAGPLPVCITRIPRTRITAPILLVAGHPTRALIRQARPACPITRFLGPPHCRRLDIGFLGTWRHSVEPCLDDPGSCALRGIIVAVWRILLDVSITTKETASPDTGHV